jgi:hypothetical protein
VASAVRSERAKENRNPIRASQASKTNSSAPRVDPVTVALVPANLAREPMWLAWMPARGCEAWAEAFLKTLRRSHL